MIPAPFDYEVATSVEEAVGLLSGGADDGDVKLLAGGQSLLPLMKLRFARPTMVVDIARVQGLSAIEDDGDAIAVGALARHHDVARSDLLATHCRVVAEAARQIGDPQVRHRGTVGGSVAHADPASDLPTVLLALDADVVATGPNGARTIAAADLFTGFLESSLAADEVLTQIRVPKIGSSGTYVKYHRRAQDWAMVGVAAAVVDGVTNVALTNMGPTPLRAAAVEEGLASGTDPAAAAAVAAEDTSPPSDTAASAEYRRHLARVLTQRALEQLDRG